MNRKERGTSPIQLIIMWITVIVSYGVGAGICGALELKFTFETIWLPIVMVLFVICASMAFGIRISPQPGETIELN